MKGWAVTGERFHCSDSIYWIYLEVATCDDLVGALDHLELA